MFKNLPTDSMEVIRGLSFYIIPLSGCCNCALHGHSLSVQIPRERCCNQLSQAFSLPLVSSMLNLLSQSSSLQIASLLNSGVSWILAFKPFVRPHSLVRDPYSLSLDARILHRETYRFNSARLLLDKISAVMVPPYSWEPHPAQWIRHTPFLSPPRRLQD